MTNIMIIMNIQDIILVKENDILFDGVLNNLSVKPSVPELLFVTALQ